MASSDRPPSEDSYYNDSYFFKTYVPLSNLPTPPLSAHSAGSPAGDIPKFDLDDALNSNLLGAAIHLKNLVPSSVSLLDPSIHVVHSILVQAELQLPMIALAVCILDSLNSRFALSWRRSCPLKNPDTLPRQLHIDSIHPEVIIIAALIISVKFLDDQESTTQLYAEDWGSGRWTCKQINATQQCIMDNLGYRILPLWTEELIGDALEDMETAGRYAGVSLETKSVQTGDSDFKDFVCGEPVTATVVSMPENLRPIKNGAVDKRRNFVWFSGDDGQTIELPRVMTLETFPVYKDPTVNA